MKESEVNNTEINIKGYLKQDVKLYLEQVKVQPGGLVEEVVKPPTPTIGPPKPPLEVIKSSREGVIAVVRQSSDMVEKILSPSTIDDFYVGFHDKTLKVSIVLRIKRDKPLSEKEILWLKRIFATELNLPVDLSVETTPFVPLLVFKAGETSLTDEMKNALIPINDAFIKDNSITVTLESYPESSIAYNKRINLAEGRAKAVRTILTEDYKIPESNINPNPAISHYS